MLIFAQICFVLLWRIMWIVDVRVGSMVSQITPKVAVVGFPMEIKRLTLDSLDSSGGK